MRELATDRLVLRRWRADDLEPFAAVNADPVVMEHFPAPLTRQQSDAVVTRIEERFERDGFGWWAVEVAATGELAGFVGLAPVDFEAHFTPAVEVGWRLGRAHWGRGYAVEAARAALDDAARRCGVHDVVSFTALPNLRSQRVMQKLGMTRNPREDFDHPKLAPGHPLRRHVLYRLGPQADRPTAAGPDDAGMDGDRPG